MKYYFTHIIGTIVMDQSLRVIEEVKFTKLDDYLSKDKTEAKLKKKYPGLIPLPEDKLPRALEHFKDKNYFSDIYAQNAAFTRAGVRASVSKDGLILQTIANIEELDKVCNLLAKRLREWYSLYLPELSFRMSSHDKFVELVLNKTRTELIKEFRVVDSMGGELKERDVNEILLLASQINNLYQLRKKQEMYLELIMKEHCPNLLELAGANIGAKLMELGRGLKALALLPASTIQLLGAEKALFRHLKTGSRSPKYGVLYQHQLVQKVKASVRGKVARGLADKLSLCARLDYFKGEFKAKEFREELERKFKCQK